MMIKKIMFNLKKFTFKKNLLQKLKTITFHMGLMIITYVTLKDMLTTIGIRRRRKYVIF